MLFCFYFANAYLYFYIILPMGVLDGTSGTSADVPGVGLKILSVLFSIEIYLSKKGNQDKIGREN